MRCWSGASAGLEDKMDRLESPLIRLEPRIAEIATAGAKQAGVQTIRADLAELKGKISGLPTWWLLLVALVATWSTGAAIVATMIRLIKP